ncbi:MAG: hypothetical protein QXE01_05160 [Sulfolobales archaeon]
MSIYHLVIMDKPLIKQRTVIREADEYYKIYLPWSIKSYGKGYSESGDPWIS